MSPVPAGAPTHFAAFYFEGNILQRPEGILGFAGQWTVDDV
jgi:hypothetical protein